MYVQRAKTFFFFHDMYLHTQLCHECPGSFPDLDIFVYLLPFELPYVEAWPSERLLSSRSWWKFDLVRQVLLSFLSWSDLVRLERGFL